MAIAVARVAAAIAIALAAFASDAAPESTPSSACRGPARFVDFGSDGRIGAKWNAATRTIAYGRPQVDGHYHAFIADSDGGNERRIAALDRERIAEVRRQLPALEHRLVF